MLLQQAPLKLLNANIGIDLDGTVIDSSYRHLKLLKALIDQEKININVDDYLDRKGNGISTYNYLIEKGINVVTANHIVKLWVENIEKKEFLKYDKIYSTSEIFFNRIVEFGGRLSLITARANKDNVYHQLESMNISNVFENIFIIDPSRAIKGKQEILENFNIDVMIGDSEVDYFAAINAGVKFLRIKSIFRNDEFFKKLARKEVQSYNNLMDLFTKEFCQH